MKRLLDNLKFAAIRVDKNAYISIKQSIEMRP